MRVRELWPRGLGVRKPSWPWCCSREPEGLGVRNRVRPRGLGVWKPEGLGVRGRRPRGLGVRKPRGLGVRRRPRGLGVRKPKGVLGMKPSRVRIRLRVHGVPGVSSPTPREIGVMGLFRCCLLGLGVRRRGWEPSAGWPASRSFRTSSFWPCESCELDRAEKLERMEEDREDVDLLVWP